MAIPLICPAQSVAPHDEDSRLFNKPWWLYLKNVGDAAGAARASAVALADLRLSMSDFGAVPDGLEGVTGSMAAGSNLLTILSTDTPFTPDMHGKSIAIFGAGPACYADTGHERCAGATLVTNIVSVGAGGLSVRTGANATTAVSGVQWAAGTDNRPAFSAALAAMRENNGGDLWFDESGIYFFASYGHINSFGWYFADLIDFDNCHIHQGEKAKIVIGFSMHFLSINDNVFDEWTLVADRPPIANITSPVAQGSILIECDPADLVDGSGQPRYKRNDWVLIFTGYLLDEWVGFEIPDAQICQIYAADTVSGLVVLAEPTLKPFVQENYPAPVGWTGPVGAAPFGIINVTDIIIHDFRYENLNLDSFFYTQQIYGGQVDGFYLTGVKANLRGGFHAMNYVHVGETTDVRAVIDNLASTNLPFDYAWTVAVGSSHCRLSNAQIDSTGVTYLHLHEGAANCSVDKLRLGTFAGSPQAVASNLTGGAITVGTTGLSVTGGVFSAADVVKTIQIGDYVAVIKTYIDPTHVTVFPPAPATFAGANVTVGFSINAVHVAGRSYGLKILNSRFIGYDPSAVIHIHEDCTDGGFITNCEIAGREDSVQLIDVECQGSGWRIDVPLIDPSRIYQVSTNLGPPVLSGTNAHLTAVDGTRGISSALGGVGRVGNIEAVSNDLTAIGWNAGAGVTVTANTTDILDPIGTNTASKIQTGATSANMEVSRDQFTPALGVVSGTGNNANRSFIFSFYVYSPIENQMECFVGSFVPGPGLDLTNTEILRVAVYPAWQRVDVTVNCNSSASSGTELLVGVATAVFAPVVGLNSTFYIWGATLQEVSATQPLITITTGSQVEYQDAVYSLRGKLLLDNIIVISGTGTPEAAVVAPVGSVYLRKNGAAGTVLYMKESGAGNTGWAAYGSGGSTLPVVDTTAVVKGSGDATKLVRIEADGLTTGTTRVATMPDRNITLNTPAIVETQAGANTTLTSTLADVTGASISLTVGTWIVKAFVRMNYNVSAGGVTVVLNVGGTDVDVGGLGFPNPTIETTSATGTGTDTFVSVQSQEWKIILGSTITVKLRANKAINAGAAFAGGPNTTLRAVQVG